MKKFTKKVLSVALAATVSVSSLYTGTTFAKAATTDVAVPDQQNKTLTVYFKTKEGKSIPKIYAYDRTPGANVGSGTSISLVSPSDQEKKESVSMEKVSEKNAQWYKYDIKTRYGFAFVIINAGNKRFPAKADITDNAYRIDSNVCIDTTSDEPKITTYKASTLTVKFKPNKKDINSKSTPKIYAYDRIPGEKAGSYTSENLTINATDNNYVEMQPDNSSGWYTYDIDTRFDFANIIIKTEKYRYPIEKSGTDNAYQIKSNVFIDASQTDDAAKVSPSTSSSSAITTAPASTTPATTAPTIPAPTATVLATADPVKGPYVTTNYGKEAVFPDGSDTVQDSIYVELNLAGGATSATYVLDDGLPQTITKNSVIKVGEGKIANKPITLKVTSTDGTKTNTQTFTYKKLPNYNNTVKTLATAAIKKALGIVKTAAASQTYNVKFTAPQNWKGTVYAYAYYHKNDTDTTPVEPLGGWPGTVATKNSDGTYSIAAKTEIGSVRVMFSNYEDKKETAKLPTGWKTDSNGNPLTDKDGNYIGVDGYLISANSSINGTSGKVTADTSTTETPSMTAYFGAEKSAPQVNTTKQKISAVVKDASGTPHFTFYVNNTKLYEGTNNSVDWDPTQLKVGVYSLKVVIKDDKNTIELKKNYTITDSTGATPEPTATPTITPTATATTTATATAIATATATATATSSTDPAATPTATAVVTTTSDATINPDVTATPDTVPTASADVSTSPEVIPTATVVPTIVPTAVPPVTTNGAILPTAPVPNAVASASAVTGSVTFAKLNKTAGEDVVIKVATSNKKSDAKYTYSYYVNAKAIATKTTKTSATWTTSKKGTYSIKVIVYENGKQACEISSSYTVKARVITIQSFKTNKKSGQKKNTKITLTAKAKATKGKVSYKFAVQKKNGKIKTLKNFSAKKRIIWKPKQKGTYKLYVYVKNGKGVLVKKTMNFKIK